MPYDLPASYTGIVYNDDYDVAIYHNGALNTSLMPSIITSLKKEWYVCNKLHREDGTAIEYYAGRKFWFYNGKLIGQDCEFDVSSWKRYVDLSLF